MEMAAEAAANKNGKKAGQSNLMIFADKSGSMSGAPYRTLKQALLDLADQLFGETKEENAFESVHTVFYNSEISAAVTNSKKSYLDHINSQVVTKRTNFVNCFEYIMQNLKKAADGSSFYIVFLTDGRETSNQDYVLDAKRAELRQALNDLQKGQKEINTVIYTLGFSADHDASLLNFLAQSGSQTGNFVYIDTENEDYKEQLAESLGACFGMALQSSKTDKMEILNKETGLKMRVNVDQQFEFGTDDAVLDPQNDMGDGDEQIQEQGEVMWTAVKYHMTVLLKEKELLNENLVVNLQLANGIKVQGKVQLMKVLEPPVGLLRQAEVGLLNKQTFELIQKIQNTSVKSTMKKEAFEQLMQLNRSLDFKVDDFMKIRNKDEKKALLTAVHECRTRSNYVISVLREAQSLDNLSNVTIAKLNDQAYKAINKGGLQKMLDKRALQNEDLYKKLEMEAAQIASNINITKLEEEHEEILAEIGDCPLSCLGTLEAIQESDCMCIGLSISRPEAAIADPSKLVVNDIFPTYLTADSFLESAKFKLMNADGDGKNIHGGFGKQKDSAAGKAQIVEGLGREKITGVMPLYLFKEHWNIAKRKIQPIFGFMCTLDILGYSPEQFYTIPFLVLSRALAKSKAEPSEVNRRMVSQILDTCTNMIQYNKTFREEIISKIVNFCQGQDAVSHRTADVVKSVEVLALQYYALLKLENLGASTEDMEHKEIFEGKTKQIFIRYAAEEILRRNQMKEKAEQMVSSISKYLYTDIDSFVDKVFGRRKVEIEELMNKNDLKQVKDIYAAYSAMADQLRTNYGYGKAKRNGGRAEAGQMQEKKQEGQAKVVNFDEEIRGLLQTISFKNAATENIVNAANKFFKKKNSQFINTANLILDLEKEDEMFTDLYTLPLIKPMEDNFSVLLAILVQNAAHSQNSQRTDAVKNGTYVDIKTDNEATEHLQGLLTKKMKQRLLTMESEFQKKYQTVESDEVVEKILKAPDQFYAAAIMKQNELFFGRGDFKKMVLLLAAQKREGFKDIANKLAMIKTGYFYRKGIQADVNDEDKNNKGISLFKGAKIEDVDRMALFSDKAFDSTKENNAIKVKYIFNLWSTWVYKAETDEEMKVGDEEKNELDSCGLTYANLYNIFPEFRYKLELYNNCCDQTGKIVKNQAYYKEYQQKPHATSRRGCNDRQLKKAYRDLKKGQNRNVM